MRRHRAAARLCRGSAALTRRFTDGITAWVRDSTGIIDTVVRWGLLALAGWIAWYIIRSWPRLLWLLTAAWCITAWRAGADQTAADDDQEQEQDDPDQEEPDSEELPPDVFLGLLAAALGDAPGLHLTTLAERLARALPDRSWDPSTVRSLCAAAGVPVASSVREPGRNPSSGVRRRDLPPLSPTTPERGPVGVGTAGQTTPTPSPTPTPTPTPEVERRHDGGLIIIRDPAHAHPVQRV